MIRKYYKITEFDCTPTGLLIDIHLGVRIQQPIISFIKQQITLFNVPTLTTSNLSGIPEGVLGGVNLTNVHMEDCSVGVMESRAFTQYSEEASVNITFINTVITTLKMVGVVGTFRT